MLLGPAPANTTEMTHAWLGWALMRTRNVPGGLFHSTRHDCSRVKSPLYQARCSSTRMLLKKIDMELNKMGPK